MPDLYSASISAPCRAVLLTAKACGVELNVTEYNLMKGEHMNPQFIAINPQHCVPTLVDGDLKIWESRAICTYLASKYAKDDSLYPNNPRARAIVDQRLYFDMGTLYQRFGDYVYPVAFAQVKPDDAKLEKIHEALGWLNGFLGEFYWSAGNRITVADHSLAATLETMEATGIDLHKHSRVVSYLDRCRSQMPGYKVHNVPGAQMFGGWMKPTLEAARSKKDDSRDSE